MMKILMNFFGSAIYTQMRYTVRTINDRMKCLLNAMKIVQLKWKSFPSKKKWLCYYFAILTDTEIAFAMGVLYPDYISLSG